jgi:hypothetical protein
MIRTCPSQFAAVLTFAVALAAMPAAGDESLWKSGENLYINLADQDEPGTPNQHPVVMEPKAITNALSQVIVWNKKMLKEDEAETVFSVEQARTLGTYLAVGLQKARPDQDIIFALSRRSDGFLVWDDLTYMAGRAFYANDRLNIIIGDYERAPDRFMERAQGSAGITELKYYFQHGQRDDASKFKKAVIFKDGISLKEIGGKPRPDWLLIDVAKANAGYLAENQDPVALDKQVSAEAMREEAARLAQERREMRLEMARLKKEIGSGTKSDSAVSAEERLRTLEELRVKNLITDEEYQSKRREILNEL